MISTKKVLYLITKSNWGGAQSYLLDLVTSLPKDQFEATVACGGTGAFGAGSGRLVEELNKNNIPIKIVRSFTRDIFLFNEPRTFLEIGKIIHETKPDILHLNSSKAAGIGSFVGRLLGVPNIIYTVHGWPFNENRNFISKFLMYFFSWLTCFFSHKIIVINPTDFEQGKKMWGQKSKMTLIYNGISPIAFLSKPEARAKLNQIINITLSLDEKIIGTIAELHPNKNLETLIKAVAHDPHLKLIIISDGQEKNNLLKLVADLNLADRVFLTGFLADAKTYLKAFNVFALISHKEGLPYAILEAGLAGIPVVGSDIPGIRTIIDSINLGILVHPDDIETLTYKLHLLAYNSLLAETISHNLQTKIQTEFSLDKMVKETTNLYK